jgi:hypothetical protein
VVTGPDGGLTPGQTGRLAIGPKITLTLTRSTWSTARHRILRTLTCKNLAKCI